MSDLIKAGMIQLFGTIIPDKWIWPDDVGYFSAQMVIDALAGMTGDVVVTVNSDGGSPSEGEAIRAAFEAHPGNVMVKVTGNAHSAASLMIMGATEVEMSAGSLMLIHDPSTVVSGNPAELGEAAATLDVMADAYAAVYAARGGITQEAAREIMRADTMLTAPAAVEAGFADRITTAPITMAADPVMDRAMVLARAGAAADRVNAAQMRFEAAEAGLESGESQPAGQEPENEAIGENTMSKPTIITPAAVPAGVAVVAPVVAPVAMSAADAVAAERSRVLEIREAATPFMAHVGQVELDRMIDTGVTVDDAKNIIMKAAAAGQPSTSRVQIIRDERDTQRVGMTEAMVAQMLARDPADDRANDYMDLSIVEMAAELTGDARPRTTGAKANVLMNAAHSTSDFSNILGAAFNTVIESAYDIAEPTFGEFSREMKFNDFRAHDIVRPDNFPKLQKIGENGEIKFGTFGDSKEAMVLVSYATGISVSRQLMVNDSFGAIAEVLLNAAGIVPEFEEETFFAMLLANPKLSDNVDLFHATHGNLGATGAISKTTVAAGRLAMRTHKLKDGRPLKSNAPAILLCGPAKQTEAEEFLAPVLAAEQAHVNTLAKSLRLVVSDEIVDDKWFLTVDKSKKTSSFRHGYLDGARAPRIRVNDPFGSQGTQLTIEHDFACGAVSQYGSYRRG